jgi:outer membrane protein assembly factor BamB
MNGPRHRPTRAIAAAVALGALGAGTGCAAPAAAAPSTGATGTPAATGPSGGTGLPAGPGSWTVYHGNPAGTGVAAGLSSVDTSATAWTSPALDGQLYGEPLVYDGRVYVATENDTVYALSAATGAVTWSAHLGTPVPAGSLPCGNITPTVGITGTPVIDPARNEIFVVADTVSGGRPAHVLVGLSTTSGRVELRQGVDPPGADPSALLQRTGLTLDAGRVVFGMGGNYGDCGSYRGRVAAVPETGGTPGFFTVDSAAGEREGAIWMGGAAPVIDSQGNIWVTSGNGSVTTPGQAYDHSDAALELSSSLQLEQYFAPTDWAIQNANDLDMSVAPALLPGGQVLVAGKAGIAYLLDGSHLGGIGGQQAALGSVCDTDIDGGAALLGTTVFLPCLDGIVAVRAAASPPGLRLLWKSGTGGGPPVLAAGLVWTVGQDGVLYGLDPGTGAIRQQVALGGPANHFPTPSVADGLLLATDAEHVVAFRAQGGAVSQAPATAPQAAQVPSASPGAGAAAGGPPGSGIAGGYIAAAAAGGFAVILAGALLTRFALRRRNRHRGPTPGYRT